LIFVAWLEGNGVDLAALRVQAETQIVAGIVEKKAEITAKRTAETAAIDREAPVFAQAEVK